MQHCAANMLAKLWLTRVSGLSESDRGVTQRTDCRQLLNTIEQHADVITQQEIERFNEGQHPDWQECWPNTLDIPRCTATPTPADYLVESRLPNRYPAATR